MEYKALIACLGNPGPEYAATRHNFGFFVADKLLELGAQRKSMRLEKLAETPDLHLWSLHLAGAPHLLLKPMTYMNLSGKAVSKVAGQHALPPERVVVLHDELDLPLGRIKFRQGGSTNGHRGLESIVEHLGAANFWRMRLGVGRPAASWEVRDWVLENFPESDMKLVAAMTEAAVKGLDLYARKGARFAVQHLHSLPLPEQAERSSQEPTPGEDA
ncbi:aminoacyl-tRNA hydrolase [Paucidesulfovibrio longus]|uniref:aminoacyl-tRNA hydrolase n=1 Tax=Paucidesulfovibrio longus TaxID=889 RepID=UPI0003B6186A|nr:aminoacyl-tRNA hydrolase [Paucidesulfovibrio longus]